MKKKKSEVIGMYEPKTEKEIKCPLEYGLDIFGGKWKSRIICVLATYKILRYKDLRNELSNITDAVLSCMLKEMANDGIVLREQYNEIPPRVEYSLTEKGESVLPILKSICFWSAKYIDKSEIDVAAPCKNCRVMNS
jgi:DNA-binding HxlR family transcriptional regulator